MKRALLAATATLAVLASGFGAPPSSAAPEPAAKQTTAIPKAAATITLITGDQVDYRVDAAGRAEADFLGETPFRGESGPDGVYVIPEAAEPYLASGLLDKELFDVQYLAEHGYADAQRSNLPVIAKGLNRRAKPLAASHAGVVLESIGATAVSVDKKGAKAFWNSLTKSAAKPAKIWLDQQAEVALDESVPQIGAPEAWADGFDGSGIKVAVLDTGIDAEHPDLAGKVVASQSFVPGQSVDDGHGHGTHVASTIAGSGSASGGRYKGVAPGAELLVGKVLSNAGSGSVSQIIDGMEWAAAQGADVVSMSLGAGPSDGSDILSQTVNELTESSGTLFVIAAGNKGPDAETVAAPGSAERALTVGAVDKQDQLASFSSRGPLVTSDRRGARRRYVARHAGRRALHHTQRYVDGDAARRRRGGDPGAAASGLDRGAAEGRPGGLGFRRWIPSLGTGRGPGRRRAGGFAAGHGRHREPVAGRGEPRVAAAGDAADVRQRLRCGRHADVAW
jgi:hypothetical protein